jgi:hypothetical protein
MRVIEDGEGWPMIRQHVGVRKLLSSSCRRAAFLQGIGTERGLEESSSWSITLKDSWSTEELPRHSPTQPVLFATLTAYRYHPRATIIDMPVGRIMGMYTIARLRNIIESLPRSKAIKPMYNTQNSDEYHCHQSHFRCGNSYLLQGLVAIIIIKITDRFLKIHHEPYPRAHRIQLSFQAHHTTITAR